MDRIVEALRDSASKALVLLGEYGDDRVELVTRAHQLMTHRGNIVHVVGTSYAQKLRYGAVAFLQADLEGTAEHSPSEIMKAISTRVSDGDGAGILVLQYPQLLDVHSRAVLAQLAFNRSITLVILAEHAEVLPPEFTQLCRTGEHHELRIGPLSLEESHEILSRNFSASPTPMALAALWNRSHGIRGWLTALAHEALASGKLIIREGYLVLGEGPWPHGGRLEAMSLSQTAVLQHTERDLLCSVAREGTVKLRDLDSNALDNLDRLIAWGFIRRSTDSRDSFEVRSGLLAGELRAASGDLADDPQPWVTIHGNFHDFLAGTSPLLQNVTVIDEAKDVRLRLQELRSSLLDGELGLAHQQVKNLLWNHRLLMPEELLEVAVLAQAILDVIGVSPDNAQPALESIGIQLEGSGSTHDQWLVQSMGNFLKDDDGSLKHAPIPFDQRWDSARWWFSELLASRESTLLGKAKGNENSMPPMDKSGILELLVGIRQGFRPATGLPSTDPGLSETRVKTAMNLMLCNDSSNPNDRMVGGLEILFHAGFAIFVHPWSNHALDQLTETERTGLANKLKRGHRDVSLDGWSHSQGLQARDYPVLEVLTKREKFVANAAAQGRNNQQIAREAGVSVRTVEGHLYQIYSKLSLTGRRDLSSLVAASRSNGEPEA